MFCVPDSLCWLFRLALSSAVNFGPLAYINSDPPPATVHTPWWQGAKSSMVVKPNLSPPAAYRPKGVCIKMIKHTRWAIRSIVL